MLTGAGTRLHCERGQTAAEYIGMILVIVAVVAAIATSGIGGAIASGIENAICSVGGGSCADDSGSASSGTGSGSGPGSSGGDRGGAGPGGAPGAAVVPPVTSRGAGGEDRDGVDPGPDRGSPADRGSDGRSGPAGERPRDAEGAGPEPAGGGPESEAPANGAAELGPDGGPVPEPFDPPAPDEGSGEHGSEGDGIGDRLNKEKWYAAAEAAELLGLTDAARHLRHYLDNSGEPLEVDVESTLEEEPDLRESVGNQVDAAVAQALEAYDGSGSADIPFRTGWATYTAKNRNWYLGLGSMNHSATGTIHIAPGQPPRVTVTYRIRVHDRYNWDGGKSTEIGPFTVDDRELQELHRKGLAQEYDVDGTSDEITVTVDPSDTSSTQPPEGDGRDGSRGDPGRPRG